MDEIYPDFSLFYPTEDIGGQLSSYSEHYSVKSNLIGNKGKGFDLAWDRNLNIKSNTYSRKLDPGMSLALI